MNSCVHFLFDTVRRCPEGTCISDDREEIRFLDFFRRSFALAGCLTGEPSFNQPVFVYLPKSVDAVVAFAAVLMSGNFYVPGDTKSPLERTKKIIQDLDPLKIITLRKYGESLSGPAGGRNRLVVLDDIPARDSRSPDAGEIIAACRRRTDKIIDMDPCYVMYTSGSTGTPKGVVVSHRGVADYIDWARTVFALDEGDVIGNQSPLFFDNSTLDIYLGWSTGAALHLTPESAFVFPAKLVEHLENRRVTFVFFVPSVLIAVSQMKALSSGRLPKLKWIAFAGEVMPAPHLSYWQTLLPDKRYVNLYGPTEITVDCTYFVVDRVYGPGERLPIGYPCMNSGILILNDRDQIAAAGEEGELCVRGSSLALGYWNDKEKTRSVFVQNPLQPHYLDLIYRTGDIVVKNAGGPISFVGRRDSQIKHLGYRIELGEIERAAGGLPGVNRCCALYDQANRQICLFYESDGEIPPARLIEGLSSIIPGYMVPRAFRHYSRLPMSPSGKVDRKALLDVLA